jgi:hypothetical protein
MPLSMAALTKTMSSDTDGFFLHKSADRRERALKPAKRVNAVYYGNEN